MCCRRGVDRGGEGLRVRVRVVVVFLAPRGLRLASCSCLDCTALPDAALSLPERRSTAEPIAVHGHIAGGPPAAAGRRGSMRCSGENPLAEHGSASCGVRMRYVCDERVSVDSTRCAV
jgi:hypothetical protein